MKEQAGGHAFPHSLGVKVTQIVRYHSPSVTPSGTLKPEEPQFQGYQ